MSSVVEQKMIDPNTTITPRQLELIALYASGYTLEQIGQMKFMSYSSVKQILAEAKDRVMAKSLTHLCSICVEHGLLRASREKAARMNDKPETPFHQAGLYFVPVHPDGIIEE